MAKFCPLFSGSSGNCTYIASSSGGILIDAGVSAKSIVTALAQRSADIADIKAIFITHEHSDHTSALRVLTSKYNIPVYATNGTINSIGMHFGKKTEHHAISGSVCVANMEITAFKTPHDSRESCGFIVQTTDRRIAVCTDLGCVTDDVRDALTGCDLVMLESNHDTMMLQNGRYPYFLKRRVMSKHGHLSNAACADELSRLVNSGTTRFVLAHLSRENNVPFLAVETARAALAIQDMEEGSDYLLYAAPPANGRTMVL